MRKQNSFRVINEDIAALRNIAWAIIQTARLNDNSSMIASVVFWLCRTMLQDAKDLAPETHAYNVKQIKDMLIDWD